MLAGLSAQIYVHLTCATDTSQIRFVLSAVNDIVRRLCNPPYLSNAYLSRSGRSSKSTFANAGCCSPTFVVASLPVPPVDAFLPFLLLPPRGGVPSRTGLFDGFAICFGLARAFALSVYTLVVGSMMGGDSVSFLLFIVSLSHTAAFRVSSFLLGGRADDEDLRCRVSVS